MATGDDDASTTTRKGAAGVDDEAGGARLSTTARHGEEGGFDETGGPRRSTTEGVDETCGSPRPTVIVMRYGLGTLLVVFLADVHWESAENCSLTRREPSPQVVMVSRLCLGFGRPPSGRFALREACKRKHAEEGCTASADLRMART